MPDPDPWTCEWCFKKYPVPSMREICEARHEQELDEQTSP